MAQKAWFIDIPVNIWERIVNHVLDNVRVVNKQDKIKNHIKMIVDCSNCNISLSICE